jgi:hypothetical protein
LEKLKTKTLFNVLPTTTTHILYISYLFGIWHLTNIYRLYMPDNIWNIWNWDRCGVKSAKCKWHGTENWKANKEYI